MADGLGNSARKRDGQQINYLMPNRENGVAVDVGIGSTFGALTSIIAREDYRFVMPFAVSIITAAVSSETVTVRFTATYENNTTQYVDITSTSDETLELTAENIADLYTTEKNIKQIDVSAHTSDNLAGPTVTLNSFVMDYP